MYLLPIAVAVSLAALAQSATIDCHARPSDFLSGEQYWSGIPADVETPVKNRIYVLKSGEIT